jgi:hypothetical protein
VKYVRTPGFLIDLRRLPEEHRKMFVQAVHETLRPALDDRLVGELHSVRAAAGHPVTSVRSCAVLPGPVIGPAAHAQSLISGELRMR